MKTKRLLVAVSITALILIIIFVSLKAYYVAVALIVGILIIGHRELWSLIKKRRLPPVDERVRGNINKSIRNSFIFFGIFSILTMLVYIKDKNILQPDLEYFLGGLLLAVGIIYLLSYIFYDRVEANLNDRWLKIFKTVLLISGIALGVVVFNIFFFNSIPRILNIDYFALHVISLYTSLLVFAVGLIGGLVIFIKGLLARSP
jgi:hypothetical protein